MKYGDLDSVGAWAGFLAFFIVLAFTFKNSQDFNNIATTVTTSVKNLANV